MWLGSFGRRLGLGLGGLEEEDMFVGRSWGDFWFGGLGSGLVGSLLFLSCLYCCQRLFWCFGSCLFLARRWCGTRSRELWTDCPGMVVTAVEDISVYLIAIFHACISAWDFAR
jgi:hypothetical protein